jgi:type IX secretion system PorP/SprF family membrane protein
MKKTKLFLIAGLALPLLSAAQDIHFSQLTQTPLLLNPANTALAHDLSVYVNYRDQWRSVSSNPFKTFNFSADVGLFKNKEGSHAGFGIDIFSDKAGDGNMGTTAGQLDLSYVLATNDQSFISVGIMGGFGQRSLDYANLVWDNQYVMGQLDPTLPTGEPLTFANRSYMDIGAGAAWYYGTGNNTISSNDAYNFTVGLAAFHLNQPVYTFYGNTDNKLPIKYLAHASGEIGIKNFSLVVEPGVIVMVQGGHHEINVGSLFKYWLQEASVYTGRKKPAAFVLGGYYRFADAFNVVAGYEMYPFRLGLSYDVNLSGLTSASSGRGGFEISLRFLMADDGKSKNKQFFN